MDGGTKHTTAKMGGQSTILMEAVHEDEDRTDAESVYSMLEKEIVPLYYERDRRGVPHQWIKSLKKQ